MHGEVKPCLNAIAENASKKVALAKIRLFMMLVTYDRKLFFIFFISVMVCE